MVAVISESPWAVFRACRLLATANRPLARHLFPPAFFSCWIALRPAGQVEIARVFRIILSAPETYDDLAREILDLMAFMHRVERPIPLPREVVVSAAIRYGRNAFALRLLDESCETDSELKQLLTVMLNLGDWTNAVQLWRQHESQLGKPEVLARLRMWDRVELSFLRAFQKSGSVSDLRPLISALAALGKWRDIFSYLPSFDAASRADKQLLAEPFAEAAMHLGEWMQFDRILSFSAQSAEHHFLAFSALRRGDWAVVDSCCANGFALLASRPVTFWESEHHIDKGVMLAAQKLVEVAEMKQWLMSPKDRSSIETVWDDRLITSERNFELWLSLIAPRVMLTQHRSSSLVRLFQLRSVSLGTSVHRNTFEMLFQIGRAHV
jgi:hypothetical protein